MVEPTQPTFIDDSPPNSADSLDGDVLGEKPGDDELPGVNRFTDRTILNSEDPAVIMGGSETEDDLRTRVWREIPDSPTLADDSGFRLVDTTVGDNSTPTLADDEKDLVGDGWVETHPSAEEAAIRVEKR